VQSLEHIRKATRFATYRGDHRESVGRVMGPNTLGEILTVVRADFDETTGKTRLGFAYGHVSPAEAA
jgi:c-di-GMP-binding flagellar brake protein YcgR